MSFLILLSVTSIEVIVYRYKNNHILFKCKQYSTLYEKQQLFNIIIDNIENIAIKNILMEHNDKMDAIINVIVNHF